jgi:hypothetical protein
VGAAVDAGAGGRVAEMIETFNKFLVAANGSGILIMNPPRGVISNDDALLLAAYIVSMADHSASNDFEDILKAVQGA